MGVGGDRKEVLGHENLEAGLRELQSVQVPEDLVDRVMAEVRRSPAALHPPWVGAEQQSPFRRLGGRWGVVAGVAAVLLGMGLAGYMGVQQQAERLNSSATHDLQARGPHEPAEVTAPGVMQLIRVEGAVTVLRHAEEVALRVGAGLQHGDVLRTGVGGRAQVAMGAGVMVQVDGQSQVQLFWSQPFELPPQIEVRQGRIEGWVEGDGASLAFSNAEDSENRVVFEQVAGGLGVLRLHGAALAVAALHGAAHLLWSGKPLVLPPGQGLRLGDPNALAPNIMPKPEPMAAELTVQLQQQGIVKAAAEKVRVVGKTQPGVLLVLAGETIAVDGEGRFSAELSVDSGVGVVQGLALDPLGRQKEVALTVTRVQTKFPWQEKG